jgi:hypothetical protein
LATCTDTGNLPLSIRSGITGIAFVLASTTQNAPNNAVLPTSEPITHGLPHGSSFPPRLNPTSWTEIATTSIKAPVKSTLAQTALSPCPEAIIPRGFLITNAPTTSAKAEIGTCSAKHHLHPIPSAIDPPKLAPQIAPNPNMPFCIAWYIPLLRNGIISEFTIVAIVINPPPPKPVRARMQFNVTTSPATAHPRHPKAKVTVEMKKQMRRPKMSDTRP